MTSSLLADVIDRPSASWHGGSMPTHIATGVVLMHPHLDHLLAPKASPPITCCIVVDGRARLHPGRFRARLCPIVLLITMLLTCDQLTTWLTGLQRYPK